MITSDLGGFAGVQLPAMQPPPANIRSSKVASGHNALLRRALFSPELAISSGQQSPRRRRTSKKMITSNLGGFAGVQPPALQPTPANIRSSEVASGHNALLRRALFSPELTVSYGGRSFKTTTTQKGQDFSWPLIYVLMRFLR